MEFEQQIEALTSINPLRVVQKKDHVVVSVENTTIYDRDFYRAFLEASRNPDNCEMVKHDKLALAQSRLKPEIAEQFANASMRLSVQATSFRHAILKLHDIASSPRAVIERIGVETVTVESAAAKFTVYDFFVFDEQENIFKLQPRSFEPFKL